MILTAKDLENNILFLERHDLKELARLLKSTKRDLCLYLPKDYLHELELVKNFKLETNGKCLEFDPKSENSTGIHFFKKKHYFFMTNIIKNFDQNDINSFLKLTKAVNSKITFIRVIEDEMCNDFKYRTKKSFTDSGVSAKAYYYYNIHNEDIFEKLY